MLKNLSNNNGSQKYLLIFNPHAGMKRKILPNTHSTSLEDIKTLLKQYQILIDLAPTKYAGHATILARTAQKKGYKNVLVAGGDGTVGEVANGLIDSDITLGILPLGSYMNIARMLAVPTDLEKAVALIKIGRSRKIDVGCVTKIDGEKLSDPYYFIESVGMGLEAELHELFLKFEQGDKKALINIVKTFFDYYGHKAKLIMDNQNLETRATLLTISNGPYSGAAIPIAPKAKLNDHRLTVSLFKMTKWELLRFIIKLVRVGPTYSPKITTYQAKTVKIITKTPRSVHADARLFGSTPIECKIIPSALNVITGFPKLDEPKSFVKRTLLDP